MTTIMIEKMNDIKIVGDIVQENLEQFDAEVQRKLNCRIIFQHWREFVGDDAEEIFPVEIIGTTLILYSDNSALKDKFKYRAATLIKKINAHFNKKIVTKIGFNYPAFKLQRLNVDENSKPAKNSIDDVEITLTDEELAECEKKSAVIADEDRRRMLFDCLVAKKKSDKLKKFSSWHKCAVCENLCPPNENLCGTCKIYERNKMFQAIRKIFYAAPYTKFADVQKKICETMPHMKAQCTLNFIESARMSLIQQTVRRISFNDKTSPLAKFLVMLVRQLPEESLTEKIIDKTLYEFRFDFVDRPPFNPQNFKKISGKLSKV